MSVRSVRCLISVAWGGSGSRVDDAVDGLLGSLRPAEGGVAVELLAGELARGPGELLKKRSTLSTEGSYRSTGAFCYL